MTVTIIVSPKPPPVPEPIELRWAHGDGGNAVDVAAWLAGNGRQVTVLFTPEGTQLNGVSRPTGWREEGGFWIDGEGYTYTAAEVDRRYDIVRDGRYDTVRRLDEG